ncbi:MAG: efflux RND transporter periplasmic adaptor subunit [Alphaproteobacteria bacterium]
MTQPTNRSSIVVYVSATGTVQPTNKVDISSELSGTIRKVLVEYNSQVKIGQVLAELDTDKLNSAVASSRAKLAASKAKLAEGRATLIEKKLAYERKLALAATRVSSAQDVDIAKADYDRAIAGIASAEADVAIAEADLQLNETNLVKAKIVSPINGVVLARNVEPGQTVASSFQAPILFTIAEDLRQMEIQVDVDEADVGVVKEGQKAQFSVDAFPERKFEARIRQLRFGSAVVQGVVTYKAVLQTDNAELLLRPGMTATAEITVLEVVDALTVPNAALRFAPPVASANDNKGLLDQLFMRRGPFRPASQKTNDGPNRRVWILKDGVPVAVTVVTGATDGQRTEIVKGDLKVGQAVIVDTTVAKRK